MIRSRLTFIPAAVMVLALCQGAAGALPAFPPGVRLLREIPAARALPPQLEAFAVEVDWTSALLRGRLAVGMSDPAAVPRLWDTVEPDSLKIQLSEPLKEEEGWRLALPADADGPDGDEGARDRVRVGGFAPWVFTGPAADVDRNPVSPLTEGSRGVAVRWLGHPADWTTRPPAMEMREAFLLSSFDPMTGVSRFFLLVDRTRRLHDPRDLAGWIAEAFTPREWLAIHSTGPQTIIGMGDWRLGETSDSRAPSSGRTERVGAALVLRAVKPGEPVDWMRVGRVRIEASSSMPQHPAENVASGLVWPLPLRPTIWMSRNSKEDFKNPAWLEVEFPVARVVSRVNLIFAEAAGWSAHFNPAEIRITLHDKAGSNFAAPIILKDLDRPWAELKWDSPRNLTGLRVEFTAPSRTGHPNSAARLAALQCLGPRSQKE